MVTKDEFIEGFKPLICSICLEGYNEDHVPVRMDVCGHVFGAHCLANAVETEMFNNNRCPLCRNELFEQEDFDEDGERIRDENNETREETEDEDDENTDTTVENTQEGGDGTDESAQEEGDDTRESDDETDVEGGQNRSTGEIT